MSKEEQKKLVIIDSNALLHRSYHALPDLKSPTGEPTGALYGFTSFLLKMMREVEPDYIAAAFDRPEPTFRHEEFEEYKATRSKTPDDLVQQIERAHTLLKKFHISVFEEPGFEADDVIATLSNEFKKNPELKVVVVSGDLDTLQLVDDDKVVVLVPGRGISDPKTYNEEAVRERYGLSPDQLPDFKGLKGDSSDNVPGVKGIGKKSASKVLKKYGTLEKLYKELPSLDISQLSGRDKNIYRKLKEAKETALFSKYLTTLRYDAPVEAAIEDLEFIDIEDENLKEYFKKLGFGSLISRLNKNYIPTDKKANEPRKKAESKNKNSNKKEEKEYSSLPPNVLFMLPLEDDNSLEVFGGDDINTVPQEDICSFKKDLKNDSITKIGWDIKRDIKSAQKAECDIRGNLFDMKVAAWLISSEERSPDLAKLRKKYSPAALFKWYKKKLNEMELMDIYKDIEMPIIPILADMEQRGIRINRSGLKKLSDEISREIEELEEKIYETADTKFNLNSPKQISEVLFDRLDISTKGVKKTPGGALSTNAESLNVIADRHPTIPLILEYRELFKLKSTYIDALPEHIDEKTERLHTTFNQTGTVTGRISSEQPNLQNIPHGSGKYPNKIRESFIAEEGFTLVSLDYSQIELRIAASLSADEAMVETFREGKDIHTLTAAMVQGVSEENVEPDMRRMAKTLNFGIIYGMGSTAFAKASGLSRSEAKNFIDEYFKKFPGIIKFQNDILDFGRTYGYVENAIGRRRWLKDLRSGHPRYRAAAERMAINFPIQSLDADIMKMAMKEIAKVLRDEGVWGTQAFMLLQIHDQLLFEIHNDILQETTQQICSIMESVYSLDVPLVVDVKTGNNWGNMKLST